MDNSPIASSYRSMTMDNSLQHSGGAYEDPPRAVLPFIVRLVILTILLALDIAGMSTNIFTQDTTSGYRSDTLWSSKQCAPENNEPCSSESLPLSSACDALQSRERAMQAFPIITLLFLLVEIATVGAQLAKVLAALELKVSAALRLGEFFFSLLCWSVIAGAFHIAYCSDASMVDRGFKLSTGWALFLVAWFVDAAHTLYFFRAEYVSHAMKDA